MGVKDIVIIGLVAVTAGLITVGYMQRPIIWPVTGTQIKQNSLLDKEACIKAGGKWGTFGDNPNQKPRCNPRATDAGKACTDNNECENRICIPPDTTKPGTRTVGNCYELRHYYGCTRTVENGVVTPFGICSD